MKQKEKIMNKNAINMKKSKKKCIILIRVSTAKQKKGTSPKIQMKWAKKKAEELKADIIQTINVGVSGKNWLKEYEEEILGLIKQEKIDYALVYNIKRFTRRLSPGVDTLDKMHDLNCSLVTSSEVITPKTDLLLPHIQMAIAEHNRNDIVEKGREGTLSLLGEGKYPFKYVPIGVKVINNNNSKDDRKASFNPKFKQLIIDLFNSINETEEYTKTALEINTRYKEILPKPLSADQVKGILTNSIYIGFFQYEEKRIGLDGSDKIPHQQLIAIDEELFNRTQKTIERISKKRSKTSKTPLKDGLSDFIDTLGFDVVMNNTDEMLRLCCPKCRSFDLEKNGPETIHGHFIQKYTCKNKKCGYPFRFPSAKQIKKLKSIDPRRCPRCGSADDFTIVHSMFSDYLQVTCNKCKYSWLAPVSDNKFKKLFDQQRNEQ